MLKAQSLSLHTGAVLKFPMDSVCTPKGTWTYAEHLVHPQLVTLCVSLVRAHSACSGSASQCCALPDSFLICLIFSHRGISGRNTDMP